MADLWFARALLPAGWRDDVRIVIRNGTIAEVQAGVPPAADDERHEVALPGLPNLHSHAFQRAMAGLAEAPAGPGRDDFWSWRELMYRLVARVTPEDCAAIAAMAYAEMLEAGFTRVGEFHYLHRDPAGRAYDNAAEMALALVAAAERTGIALTLLPVFYAHAGFGGLPPRPEQRRFVNDLDSFAELLQQTRKALEPLPHAVVGIAPHSLRAVTPEELTALGELAPSGPFHIHVAEQAAEVEACLAWSGARPVEWLFDHAPVDARWCLVHATHVGDGELRAMAASQAVVGLCPITEANLGDGIFPAARFAEAGGRFGIGSDSNVRIDAAEELRLLEYGQRLTLHRRNVMAEGDRSTGRTLFEAATAGGAQALGADAGGLAAGAPADIVALRGDRDAAADRSLDRWIFGPGHGAVETVWRAGRPVVTNGRHVRREEIAAEFDKALRRLAV